MSFTNEDWGELLDHLRRRVREGGFADLDDTVALDFQASDSGRNDFLRYLSNLINGLNERSYAGYSKALRTLQSGLQVEGADAVDGIEVVFTDADARVFGQRNLNLQDAANFGPLVKELELLKEFLARKGLLHD